MRDNGEIGSIASIGEDGRDSDGSDEGVNFDVGNKSDHCQNDALNQSALQRVSVRIVRKVHVITQYFFPSTPTTG